MVSQDKATLGMAVQVQPSKGSLASSGVCTLSFHHLSAPKLTVGVASIFYDLVCSTDL